MELSSIKLVKTEVYVLFIIVDSPTTTMFSVVPKAVEKLVVIILSKITDK